MILAIDTSSSIGSIAVGEIHKAADADADANVDADANAEILFSKQFQTGREKGGNLFEILKEIQTRFSLKKLDEIIVGLGPGSYSGIRIAIASASGLSLATNALLVGKTSAVAFPSKSSGYHVVGDARQEMFYYTLIVENECKVGPLLLAKGKLEEFVQNHPEFPVYSGDRLELTGAVVEPNAPDAKEFLQRYRKPKNEELAKDGTLEPIYLRPAIS